MKKVLFSVMGVAVACGIGVNTQAAGGERSSKAPVVNSVASSKKAEASTPKKNNATKSVDKNSTNKSNKSVGANVVKKSAKVLTKPQKAVEKVSKKEAKHKVANVASSNKKEASIPKKNNATKSVGKNSTNKSNKSVDANVVKKSAIVSTKPQKAVEKVSKKKAKHKVATGKTEKNTVKHITPIARKPKGENKLIDTAPVKRTADEKKELGLLNVIHRVNVNGNPVCETQDKIEIMKQIRKHIGKAIHIERRANINKGSFDVDQSNVEICTEGDGTGWLTEPMRVSVNQNTYYEGKHPDFIIQAVEECLDESIHVQENAQILIKPVSLFK